MRTTPKSISTLKHGEIFVFGSNEAGYHGAGAARLAHDLFGAQLMVGYGEIGRTFAIPTKDREIKTLPLWKIRAYIRGFLIHAAQQPEHTYLVTQIGCGLAGYTPEDIAPYFKNHPKNVILPKSFYDIINH